MLERLIKWIEQGAKYIEHRQLKRVEVTPDRFIATKIGEETRLKVVAHYDDGLTRDVTNLTQFVAEDSSAVALDTQIRELSRGMRPGRHIVIARYSTEVIPVELVVPAFETVVNLSSEARHNFVDKEILEALANLRLPVSPTVDNRTFMRRITLDLSGRLPEYRRETRYGSFESRNGHRRITRLRRVRRFLHVEIGQAPADPIQN